MLSALFALLAGVVTVAAPCTLPVLPILLGASFSQAGKTNIKTRPLFIASGFIAAFAAVTLVFSAFARFAGLEPNQLRTVAIVLLASFGVLMVWPGLYARLSAAVSGLLSRGRGGPARNTDGAFGGFVLGATLGARGLGKHKEGVTPAHCSR